MQCLGGNGYINGKEVLRRRVSRGVTWKFRLPDGQNTAGFAAVHCRGRHTGDQADADWTRIQRGAVGMTLLQYYSTVAFVGRVVEARRQTVGR